MKDFIKPKILHIFVLLLTLLIFIPSNAQMDKTYEHLVFQEADIKAIFQFIANESGVNIIVNPSVSAAVTLDLRNIQLQRVVDILLETYDLTMIRENNYYRVMTTAQYRESERDALEYERQKKSLQNLETRIFQVRNATATEMLSSVSQAISDRGEAVVDQRSNSIIVTDVPEQFPKIQSILDDLDIATKQVKISAKIMLIDKSFLEEVGVSWNAETTPTSAIGLYDDAGNYIEGTGAATSTNSVSQKLGHFTWGVAAGDYNFLSTISAILSRNSGKIIDQPNITTIDNKEAEIFSGEEIPISSLDEAGNTMTKFYDVGTTLRITPHITVDNDVLLDMYVERNGYITTASGYSILKRTATTTMIIGEDEVAVIGGVTTTETIKGKEGIPILMDLPLIGRLFKFSTEQDKKSELVIFVEADILE